MSDYVDPFNVTLTQGILVTWSVFQIGPLWETKLRASRLAILRLSRS